MSHCKKCNPPGLSCKCIEGCHCPGHVKKWGLPEVNVTTPMPPVKEPKESHEKSLADQQFSVGYNTGKIINRCDHLITILDKTKKIKDDLIKSLSNNSYDQLSAILNIKESEIAQIIKAVNEVYYE